MRERQRDRQTETEGEIERERQTEIQRDRKRQKTESIYLQFEKVFFIIKILYIFPFTSPGSKVTLHPMHG